MQNIDEICDKYYQVVYKYLFCLTRDTEISKDLTQETFYKAVKKIHTFKGQAKISVWLCEIAKNLWYDELKKNKKKFKQEEITEIASDENIEGSYIDKEEILEMHNKINKLDESTKRVMYLRINGDLSFKEIGEILGKTETWARITFYRGKQKIKEDK